MAKLSIIMKAVEKVMILAIFATAFTFMCKFLTDED